MTFAIHEPGYYKITARAATASDGGNIEVRNWDSLIATIPVNGDLSDGWEEWYTTEPVEAGFNEGFQVLKFTFTGGDGYLFNFNWFDLAFSRGFEQDTTTGTRIPIALQTFPNPFVTSTHIIFALKETSIVDLQIFSSNGTLVRSLVSSGHLSPGRHTFTWNGDDGSGTPLQAGVYFVRLQCNRNVIHKKMVMVSGN
jgi:hypothetical protein